MNDAAYNGIIEMLEVRRLPYHVVHHEPCKTSEESRAARAKAGFPDAVGAKALLTKLYFKDREQFATIVLPGEHVLDKDKLIALIPDLKKIRFVSPEEMNDLAGVVPGCMPPFAAPLFPKIQFLILASAVTAYETLAFNAAYLDRSIVLAGKDYLSLVTPAFVIDCSTPKV